ncbi:hypothetical protein Bca101_008909 [Brassica carinata]
MRDLKGTIINQRRVITSHFSACSTKRSACSLYFGSFQSFERKAGLPSKKGPATWDSRNLVVKDLLHPGTGRWNREVIQAVLPFHEDRILRLQPSKKGAVDALKWLGTKDGNYTVKSGYHASMAEITETILENEATRDFDWRKTVWNLTLAPKVKIFTWKCLKGILPVGERLIARHIAVDSRCKRCGSLESINHLLFHCPFAREVWNHSPLGRSFEVSGLTYLRADWSELQACKSLPPAGITSTPLVPWILWFMWKARNKYVFENFAGNPVDLLSQVVAAAREWETSQLPAGKSKPSKPPEIHAQVSAVAQSDAAWIESSHIAGLGWTIKSTGQQRKESRGVSFVASSLIAEGLALRDAMDACRSMGLKEVRFESDSAQLIKAINGKEPKLELYCIVEDIHSMAKEFEVVVFVWISRLSNIVADVLAKNALNVLDQEVVGDLFPPPE